MAEILRGDRPLGRAQRRRMEQLSEAVDRVTQADAKFFERFPDRNHRIRLMSKAEQDQNAAVYGDAWASAPSDEQWHVAVRQVAAGVRMRLFFLAMTGADTDQPETVCKSIFDHAAGDNGKAAEIEAAMRAALARRPA